ncbi:MAG: nucleotide exchange factor GrpE [Oscillospiraceae bacterium]|jgi:molecular chaperone GrpE|nr:nucleotide exchange factor GrpE [Oscillospiraceae bacterium]
MCDISANEAPETADGETAAPGQAAAEEIAALEDKYLRLAAEYDNYRKRSARERAELRDAAAADTLRRVLPLLDDLERAAASPCANADCEKGVNLICKKCAEIFTSLGVEEIEAEGRPFDPELHDGVLLASVPDVPEQTVVEVLRKGYRMGEVILRHAQVKVSN